MQQLFAYLNSYDLLCPFQSAYHPCHSADMALLEMTDDIVLTLDNGNISFLTHLHLSSTFQLVLSTTVFSHTDFNLSAAFLAPFFCGLNLAMMVGLGLCQWPEFKPFRRFLSVPQGSALGPILFILYFTPLSSLTETHFVSNQSFMELLQSLPSWSNIHHCLDHADIHFWCDNLDDTKQTETKDDKTDTVIMNLWQPGRYKTNWNQRWQDRCCYYEIKLENHFSGCSAHFFLCWHHQHSVHRLLAALVSWFQITWLFNFTSTFQLSAILHTWKSGRSALSASAWLLKQPKLCAVPLFSPS